jgi:hypothetical protein
MSDGDDLDVGAAFTEHDDVRKPREQEATSGEHKDGELRWLLARAVKCPREFCQKSLRGALTPLSVPFHCSLGFREGFGVDKE